MRILVAEDNLFYCRMLEATLAEWGYEVVAVHDGRAAYEILQGKDRPKLAIIDWMMPGLDGLELCRRVRARPEAEPPYIILLTAKDGRENIIAGLKGGADDYIHKPFDREELRARLQVGLRIVGLQASLASRVKELEYALSGAQKMEAVGRLAGGVAHDFNNLLTVILNGSEILSGLLPRDGKERELLHMIKQSGERGARLTRQLLAFSRKQVLVPEVLHLNAVVTNIEKLLRCLVGESIELAYDLEEGLGCVKADRGQIEQAVLNLAANARDAMPRGGTLTIQTRNVELAEGDGRAGHCLQPGPYVQLVVRDDGCGMTEEVKARVFEPFFTTKDVGKGTGLGLATVYGIVHQSEGHIEVESAPGEGATFFVYLPRAEATPAPVENRPRPSIHPGARETVLLVEDEDSVRSMVKEILKINSYTVLEARNGPEALRVSEQWPRAIHLMLTDVMMPQTSGPQLAEQLLPRRPDMKVLFMSGYLDEAADQNDMVESGTPFLQKPFTPGGLARKVREVLDN